MCAVCAMSPVDQGTTSQAAFTGSQRPQGIVVRIPVLIRACIIFFFGLVAYIG